MDFEKLEKVQRNKAELEALANELKDLPTSEYNENLTMLLEDYNREAVGNLIPWG